MKRLALLVFAAVAFTVAAVAQTATPAQVVSPLEAYRPLLQDIATLAFTALSGLVARFFWVKWGIDITAERREAFQIATTNAAGIVANSGDMGKAVEYLKEAAPDAIRHFKIPDEKLSEKIEAKVGLIEAAGATIPVMPGSIPPRT